MASWTKLSNEGSTTTSSSKWAGKRWAVLGDSISDSATSYKKYHAFIAEKIGCIVNNYGLDGTGYIGTYRADYRPFPERLNDITVNPDLVTVFGGTNDWAQVGGAIPLGAFGDTTTATFYGAVRTTLNGLITKFPTKTIAVFTPIPRNYSDTAFGTNGTNTLEQFTDAIIKECNRLSIPVCDLYRNSGAFPFDATYRTNYMPDGLHPNDAGQQRLADKILSFLNTL